jgi:hypothetical protein
MKPVMCCGYIGYILMNVNKIISKKMKHGIKKFIMRLK